MTLQPIFSFRDADVCIQVEAEDPYGLVSTLRETVSLDLLHLLRFFLWHPQDPGKTDSKVLRVVLEDICEPPFTVTWTLSVAGSWPQFQKSYVKKPTALIGLQARMFCSGLTIPTACCCGGGCLPTICSLPCLGERKPQTMDVGQSHTRRSISL